MRVTFGACEGVSSDLDEAFPTGLSRFSLVAKVRQSKLKCGEFKIEMWRIQN